MTPLADGGGLELRLRPAAAEPARGAAPGDAPGTVPPEPRSDSTASGASAWTVPLDRIAFADVELVARGAVTVSARLNLVEGDLEIDVTAPGRPPLRATWPWPVDSAPRSVELAAGERLVASVPLLASGSAPLFPAPGRYVLTARFAARPGETIEAQPVELVRTVPSDTDAARTAGLGDRDVLQSLLGAGVIGAAEPALERLAASADAGTAAAANLALGRTAALAAAADDPAVTRAVAALLPPGATGPDERRDAVLPAAGARSAAALTGRALPE
ncbi:hypothetical protein B1729_18705 [Microbacterium sp. B35-04]|uniref:hypothetical protein n=1 Tax=Microbacterium sp. B35-04 TaxID=1961716 RepID=UPI0013D06A58|nr:hypothetical protein [Microbacterium sp. B35-04]KAF2411741.1 hypothetical protein B1729_18705 [Microbacterium sp. B35-04]